MTFRPSGSIANNISWSVSSRVGSESFPHHLHGIVVAQDIRGMSSARSVNEGAMGYVCGRLTIPKLDQRLF